MLSAPVLTQTPSRPRPQDRVPAWVDDKFSRGQRPKTVGTVIDVVDGSGERGLFRLDRMEATSPFYPHIKSQVWVSVHDDSTVLPDSEVHQWRPYTYPDTEAGDLEEAYRGAMHYLGQSHRRLDAEMEDMMKESGLDAYGLRITAAATLISDDERAPVAMLYGSNADGTRPFRVGAFRASDGRVEVQSHGDVNSRRAQKAIAYFTDNGERIMKWREDTARSEQIRNTARRMLHEYQDVTGDRM